ncbi:hypothetical protein C8A03DRAFT_30696 [Achaetomium macrosporum]|uniref:Core Histone H2A/H2B/H3 domain-containing protein n=1 Tax=Achaetomium macrosporum TaxID=79813 RepID=A0AAN7CH65_9PEZI|nr:hypothetical protein C8A03DRAFT_30696 [Achaetomium macrosporum]
MSSTSKDTEIPPPAAPPKAASVFAALDRIATPEQGVGRRRCVETRKKSMPSAKKRKSRASMVARRRKSKGFLVPEPAFARLARAIARDLPCARDKIVLTARALRALQEAAEVHIVKHLELCYKAACSEGRVTLLKRDMDIARKVLKKFEPWLAK